MWAILHSTVVPVEAAKQFERKNPHLNTSHRFFFFPKSQTSDAECISGDIWDSVLSTLLFLILLQLVIAYISQNAMSSSLVTRDETQAHMDVWSSEM